jgi:hypothetical protein
MALTEIFLETLARVMAVYQQDRQPRFYLKFFPNFPQFPID